MTWFLKCIVVFYVESPNVLSESFFLPHSKERSKEHLLTLQFIDFEVNGDRLLKTFVDTSALRFGKSSILYVDSLLIRLADLFWGPEFKRDLCFPALGSWKMAIGQLFIAGAIICKK